MSTETMQWLNNFTLIGNTDNRGNAWHYREDMQGDEPNHYAGSIPAEDVERRLFPWSPVAVPLNATTEDGQPIKSDKIIVYRDDTLDMLGVFSDGYVIHDYKSWLIDNVSRLIGKGKNALGISSAGLLKNGAQAWLEISVPESVETPEGVTFRPNLLASTSLDGSLATSYRRTLTATVCDNTLAMALSENAQGQVWKAKHTANSVGRIKDAQEALNLLNKDQIAATATIKALCETEVSDAAWKAFLDAHVPMPEDEGRGRTMAANKRATFVSLWNNDQRVSPWKGTAFGVLQADNTYRHHFAATRGTMRTDRNVFDAIKGKTADADNAVLATLTKVLESV